MFSLDQAGHFSVVNIDVAGGEWQAVVHSADVVIDACFDSDSAATRDALHLIKVHFDRARQSRRQTSAASSAFSLNSCRSVRVAHVADRSQAPLFVALDCVTGVDYDSGRAHESALPVDLTLAVGGVGAGLLSFPAAQLCGELCLLDDDAALQSNASNAATTPATQLVTPSVARSLLPRRPRQGHKGTFGTALLCAGSLRYWGAGQLAARGALRAGVGSVKSIE